MEATMMDYVGIRGRGFYGLKLLELRAKGKG